MAPAAKKPAGKRSKKAAASPAAETAHEPLLDKANVMEAEQAISVAGSEVDVVKPDNRMPSEENIVKAQGEEVKAEDNDIKAGEEKETDTKIEGDDILGLGTRPSEVIDLEDLADTEPEAAADEALLLAPETAAEEEERLRQQRERVEEHENAAGEAEAVLEVSKFQQLEHLLNTTDMYTKFLSEQMKAIENQTDESLLAGGASGSGSKRKSQSGHQSRSKRAKPVLNPTQELLPLIQGELRDYQLKGVKWMISLYQNGLNGILADQMGLGKTVQTIGFLSHLRSKGINGPFMVIGPLSTLPNWINEFKRWCPAIPALLYHGSKPDRVKLRAQHMTLPNTKQIPASFPVIVTSYEIIIADAKPLSKYPFKYMVVDEGHRLKNFNCKLIRQLRTIPTSNKLLLTGTPLQNNLQELWSLLNFILPDVFGSLQDFQSWFDFTGVGEDANKDEQAAEQRSRVVNKLHSILKPFLLRRIKADVEIALPGKSEIVLYAHMTETQRQLNRQLLEGKLGDIMKLRVAEEGGKTVKLGMLKAVLMQMRKNCNHPDLITGAFTNDFQYPPADELVAQCGKMALLERLLNRLLPAGHKVLIFSQMTSMLDLIEHYLEEKGVHACRLDGSVKWEIRQQNINEFSTSPEAKVFLLSTRAGGLGINLTAADTCILYDSDWNPQQDLQAMDRCHRIGQTRPVLVLRLATANSVEGKMLKRAASKMMLEKIVIKQGVFKQIANHEADKASSTSMSVGELMELLKADFSAADIAQSGVADDETLDQLLDRSHLTKGVTCPYPPSGVGYEVVAAMDGTGLLQSVQ